MRAPRLLVPLALALTLATAAHAAITISTHKMKDESCTSGVCTPTGPNPNIRVKDLEKLLVQSDIRIVTGQGATGIGVLDPLTWASSHRLTLDANQSIHIRAPVVVEGTGGVTLITNDGGTGGDYYFDAPGSITFWDTTSSLVINGKTFTLEKDLKTLAGDIAEHPARSYALANNYDASVDGSYSQSIVSTAFSSTFEGLGNAVSGLSISDKSGSVSFFSYLGPSAKIRDFGLESFYFIAGISAGLANTSDGLILRCHATGSLEGPSGLMGGLVVVNSGKIIQSSASVGMTTTGLRKGEGLLAGGLVAEMSAGRIENSHADVYIDAEKNGTVGGLAGSVSSGASIIDSYATGSVDSGSIGYYETSYAGGLVGTNRGTIVGSFSSTTVLHGSSPGEGDTETGGLVATNYGSIRDSYETGATESAKAGFGLAGGLVSDNIGTVATSYATGDLGDCSPGPCGGVFGDDRGSDTSNDYWNLDTTNVTNPSQGAGSPENDPGTAGLGDAQLKSRLPKGFNTNVWGQDPNINNGWPYLLANPPQ
jgi:hypothetical protein